MDHLEDVSAADLRDALADVDGSRPCRRLIAAIAYKQGVEQQELAEWFGVERKTVYNWLCRLQDPPDALADAARDAPRPGRPRRLSSGQLAELESTLSNLPGETGYDEAEWNPALVRRHVRDEFGVDYSLSSCRRLLDERARLTTPS